MENNLSLLSKVNSGGLGYAYHEGLDVGFHAVLVGVELAICDDFSVGGFELEVDLAIPFAVMVEALREGDVIFDGGDACFGGLFGLVALTG